MAQELTPAEADKLKRDRTRVERDFWQKLKVVCRKIPFIDDLVSVYYCAIDPATPLQVKAILFGALAYFIVPFDILPDIMPLLGFGDDAAVLYAAIRTISPHIKPEHRVRAKEALDKLLQSSVS
ncbi:YkvA family protein [Dongia deserti]|uniref:YkvA family protein n=1 Tax=Dongia deserti TaxID=2268030 RepID=UPI000E64E1C0|nr:YkvA family protein [Dongia deserti]